MMNKKEQAMVDELRDALRLAKALRWTEPVQPDVPIPSGSDRLSKGFLFNSYGIGEVSPACSSSVFHCPYRDDKTTTQGPARLYSSRLLALRAMRNEMELKFAKILADVDEQIEKEMESP